MIFKNYTLKKKHKAAKIINISHSGMMPGLIYSILARFITNMLKILEKR